MKKAKNIMSNCENRTEKSITITFHKKYKIKV
jgi:hypothetical protein